MSVIELPRTRLTDLEWPAFGLAERPPAVEASELRARLAAMRAGMAAARLTHTIVYGDREHFANLAYLTHFDPRFEEALLILTQEERSPLLLVGNECEGYVGVSPLLAAGHLRFERYHPF